MPRIFRTAAIGAFAAACMTGSWAQWRLDVSSDSMTDREIRSAIASTKYGEVLTVFRASDGRAWLNLSLVSPSVNTLAPREGVMLRVDKLAPHELDGEAGQIPEMPVMYRWEPRWVDFVVWHGNEKESRSPLLDELMTGKKVVVRYALSTGGFREASFSQTGAAKAISSALKISAPRGAPAK